jgi:hypothetical protein
VSRAQLLARIDAPVPTPEPLAVQQVCVAMHGTEDRILPFDSTAARLLALIADCTPSAVCAADHISLASRRVRSAGSRQ